MDQRRFVVVGAGIMGLWTALTLREMGHEVELIDAWEPGHPRATSADESRVIRCGYGGSRLYAGWARRSLDLWDRRQREWGVPLLHRCGVLWLVAREEAYARACIDDLMALRVPHEQMDGSHLERRYPQMRTRGIRWAILEPEAGALMARRACLALAARILAAGGRFRLAVAAAPSAAGAPGGALAAVRLRSGDRVDGDEFLFACGPWMPRLFPGLVGPKIRVTHKEVFYFGTPPGDDRFSAARLPIWMELGASCYGVPSLEGKGFKLHPDLQGRRVDPTRVDRTTSPVFLRMARRCLARRFPALRGAPVVETRVCQYEATADDHMIFDRHPVHRNVWLAGGGSGHCFKHGPVIGEMIADVMSRRSPEAIPEPLRLSHRPAGRNF